MSRKKSLLLSVVLIIPVCLSLFHYYTSHSPELHPTGFTSSEYVLYMSYAHQYLDQNNFSFFYSNPFDGDPQSPKIYLQPINFLFVLLLKLGFAPGLCITLFGLLMAFLCIYLGIRIIKHVLPDNKYVILVSVLFTWGGGLTALAGILSVLITGNTPNPLIDAIYIADPGYGMWCLNWGRIFFTPLEAYYHFLFLLNIYLLLKNKWNYSIAASILIAISHPFTGAEYLLIICCWLFFEKLIFRNNKIPFFYVITIFGITLFTGWYYLIYLNSFPEHRLIFNQYSEKWTYSYRIFIPAYILVFILSMLSFYANKWSSKVFSFPHQRLFFFWAVVAFLLSKHEWFIKPMQPIHFTRGYVWAGLFLFGMPGLIWTFNYVQNKLKATYLIILISVIFLADNALWIGNDLKGKNTSEWEGYITQDTKDVLFFLNKSTTANTLLVGNAPLINYMANAYSPANTWVSHPYNTPSKNKRLEEVNSYLQTGVKLNEWANRQMILVLNKKYKTIPTHPSIKKTRIFENNTYIIFSP